jgi:flagellar motor switch protein FliG
MNDGIRKAAILVSSLDRAAADRLLEQMTPEQARAVRDAVIDLGDIAPEDQRRIVDEFFRVRPLVPDPHPAGIELDGQLARQWSHGAGEPSPEPAWEDPRETPADEGPPFRFLREAEAEKLVRILRGERPQTVALVLSHLSPEQAGRVLVRFAPADQTEIVRRLVDLEETDPGVLREVEDAIQSRLSEQVQMHRRRVAGISAVAGIIEASGGHVASEILENLACHDRQLADRLGPEPVEFDDLAALDDRSLGAVLAEVEPELLMLALVGAPPVLIGRLLRPLSEREARRVRRQLDHLGPTRLSDVETARRELAELARRLAAAGRVRLPQRTTMYA